MPAEAASEMMATYPHPLPTELRFSFAIGIYGTSKGPIYFGPFFYVLERACPVSS